MNEGHDLTVSTLSRASVPPLTASLRQRTLVLARSNLADDVARTRSLGRGDDAPRLVLVPSLLISAGVAFVVDAFIKMVHLFWAA